MLYMDYLGLYTWKHYAIGWTFDNTVWFNLCVVRIYSQCLDLFCVPTHGIRSYQDWIAVYGCRYIKNVNQSRSILINHRQPTTGAWLVFPTTPLEHSWDVHKYFYLLHFCNHPMRPSVLFFDVLFAHYIVICADSPKKRADILCGHQAALQQHPSTEDDFRHGPSLKVAMCSPLLQPSVALCYQTEAPSIWLRREWTHNSPSSKVALRLGLVHRQHELEIAGNCRPHGDAHAVDVALLFYQLKLSSPVQSFGGSHSGFFFNPLEFVVVI